MNVIVTMIMTMVVVVPINVTLVGIVTDVSPVHPEKAPAPRVGLASRHL